MAAQRPGQIPTQLHPGCHNSRCRAPQSATLEEAAAKAGAPASILTDCATQRICGPGSRRQVSEIGPVLDLHASRGASLLDWNYSAFNPLTQS